MTALFNSSPQSYDVAIIGAGPAGASAALLLAEHGIHVVILEKKSLPRYKVCGGGLLARAKNLLHREVQFPIEKEIHQLDLALPDLNKEYSVSRKTPLVYMTMRSELDSAIVEVAKSKGAELIAPCNIKNITYNKSDINISTDGCSISARFLIGADGANGVVCKSLGLKKNAFLIPAVEWEVYVNDHTYETHAHCARFDYDVAPKGYGWIFPKKTHLSTGLLSAAPGISSLKTLAENYIHRVLGEKNILSIEKHGYVIPIKPLPNLQANSRVLLTGDAAGLVDPLTAEGLTNAILSGQLAAKSLFTSGMNVDKVLTTYQQDIHKEILTELKFARGLAPIFYHKSWLHRKLMNRFGQPLCEAMGNVVLGKRSYRELLLNPRKYWNLIKSKR